MWTLVGILGQIKVKTEGIWGFPDGSVGKESTCNAGNPGDEGLIPGMGRSPGRENGNPLQYSCLKSPLDRGAWWATVHGVEELELSDSLAASNEKYVARTEI